MKGRHLDYITLDPARKVFPANADELNKTIADGELYNLINLTEAALERMYAKLADEIFERRDKIKIVFIAGPSSSGKTSSSLRLAQQCKIVGLRPRVVELDNYFVDRERTPIDENGQYDFEALEAMDLKLLSEHLNALLKGEEVELPKFDFKEGKGGPSGTFMRLGPDDMLIMEGIHALNPDMVPDVDPDKIFRIYAAALTPLRLDDENVISASDCRLLRRMARDNRTRGISPEQTLLRWPSVRRGESRNIFPYKINADIFFNSTVVYEIPLLKYCVDPLLKAIPETSPVFGEVQRVLGMLENVTAVSPDEVSVIPPTSVLREFIGGQFLQ